jgi:hypothetical protein
MRAVRSYLVSLSFFALAVGVGCRIDDSGLGELQKRDGGAAGSTGIAGSRGEAGTGFAGTSGAAGTWLAGLAGTTGTAGTSAAGGTSGSAGTNGEAGTSGLAGTSGSAGTTAAAGTSGSAGTTAAAGTSGSAGTTGDAGTTGSAGTTAAGGTTGAAGTGVVIPTCNAETCKNGCCDGATCVTARTNQRCGTGGVACAPCGACQLCGASGSCDVNPSSEWTIACDRARIATPPDFGPTWDPQSGAIGGSGPDPFCQFEMPAHDADSGARTPAAIDNFMPVWGVTISPPDKAVKAADLMSSAKTWRIWIGDDDGCSVKNGCVSNPICEINQPLTAGALLAGQVTHENLGACLSMTVRFVCADQ